MKRNLTALAILLLLVGAFAYAQNCSSVTICATSGSIGGGAVLAGACTSGTVSVAGSLTGNTVSVSPNTYPGDGIIWYGYVSANGTVTVKVCAILALTPTASTYNVRVIQ
jgi:hypothetical protein